MKVLLSLTLLAIFVSTGYAQNYELIKPGAPLPNEILQSSTSLYQQDASQIDLDQSRFEQRTEEQFYLESNFFLRELFLSGSVLFNEPTSDYVNQVADVILKHDPELRSQLNFYTVKSTAINAFATDNGSIFISLGLLGKLDSEAQLAFVLCHEIVHFVENHTLDGYVESVQIESDKQYKRKDAELKLLAKSNYSIGQEIEADDKGMELFLKSGYGPEAAIETFHHLKTYDRPFQPIFNFEKSYFELGELSFPDAYELDSVIPVSDRHDEKYSTHPDVDDRITKMEEILGSGQRSGKQNILKAGLFEEISNTARYELCYLFLAERSYEKALYCATQLQAYDQESEFLNWVISYSLYGLSKYSSGNKLKEVHLDWEKTDTVLQPLVYFINELTDYELALLAVSHFQQLDGQLESANHERMYKELIAEFKRDFETRLGFQKKSADELKEDYVLEREDTKEKNYHGLQLAMLKSDSVFQSMYSGAEKLRKRRKKSKDIPQVVPHISKEHTGFALGIDKAILVDPVYIKKQVGRNGVKDKFVASESGLTDFVGAIKENAELVGIELETLSAIEMEESEINEFIELTAYNNLVYENEMHAAEGLKLVSLYSDQLSGVNLNYDAKHLIKYTVLNLSIKRGFNGGEALIGVMFYPTLPYFIYKWLTPNYQTIFIVSVFDVESGEKILEDFHLLNSNDDDGSINSILYYQMLQLKSKGK